MPLGLLEGIASGFGEQAELARERNRQDADLEWNRRKNFLDDVMSGRYGQPTPETLQSAFEGMAELAQGPKKKKGFMSGRVRGEYENAMPGLMQRILQGQMGGDMTQAAAPTAQPPEAAGGMGQPPAGIGQPVGMPPPPGQPGQPAAAAPGAPEGMQRYAHTPPVPSGNAGMERVGRAAIPSAIPAESNLGAAVTDAAATMQENEPIQPSGPFGMFYDPAQAATNEVSLAGQRASMELQNAQGIYDQMIAAGHSPDRAAATAFGSWDPSLSTQSSRAPFGASSTTFYNPADPSQRVEARPSTTGPGWVGPGGQPVSPDWIAVPSGSSGSIQYIPGETGLVIPGEVAQGNATVHPYPGQFQPLGARNAPITERPTVTDPNPVQNRAARVRELVDEEIAATPTNLITGQLDPAVRSEIQERVARENGFGSWAEVNSAYLQPEEVPVGQQRPLGGGFPDADVLGTPNQPQGPGLIQPEVEPQGVAPGEWDWQKESETWPPTPEFVDQIRGLLAAEYGITDADISASSAEGWMAIIQDLIARGMVPQPQQ